MWPSFSRQHMSYIQGDCALDAPMSSIICPIYLFRPIRPYRCPNPRIIHLSFLLPYLSISPFFALFAPRFIGGGAVDRCH